MCGKNEGFIVGGSQCKAGNFRWGGRDLELRLRGGKGMIPQAPSLEKDKAAKLKFIAVDNTGWELPEMAIEAWKNFG